MGFFERAATYLSSSSPSFHLLPITSQSASYHTEMNSAESDKQHPETSPTSETSELSPSVPPTPESDSGLTPQKRSGRRKINIEFIEDKSRRHITFSKRKAGIMKKAYELSTLTGTQVLLLVASETGHVYTFATPKLQPLITKPDGKNLIQACLNASDTLQSQPSGQLSPGPSSYGQEAPQMNIPQQPDYGNQNSPAPMYPPQQEDEKPGPMGLPYALAPRAPFPDMKPFQAPSHQDNGYPDNGPKYGSPYATNPMMGNHAMRSPYPNTPSLPGLGGDRGSFSNLPNNLSYNHFISSSSGFNNPSQMVAPSSSFMGHSFPSSGQLFSNSPNLPALPRNDGSQ